MTKRNRNHQVSFRLNDKEYDLFLKKVEESGMSQQEFLYKSFYRKKITNTEGLKKILPQITGLCNNINQIARHCNETKSIDNNILMQVLEKEGEIVQCLLSKQSQAEQLVDEQSDT